MSELRLSIPEELLDLLAERVAQRIGCGAADAAPEAWVGVEGAARHLGTSPRRIYDLVSAARIPHRKEGRRVLFRISELDRWLEAD